MAFLKPEDYVAIVSPSGIINDTINIFNSIEILKKWNLNIIVGKNIFKKYHFFAGNDNERLEDLQSFLDNPEIKAIFCTRGGYGLMRLLPFLNLKNFYQYPKIIIGYSDITSLINFIYKKSLIPAIHGPMLNNFQKNYRNNSLKYLYSLLFEDNNIEYEISPSNYNVFGYTTGILVGGNLSIIYSLQGTPYEIDTYEKILFIEDINENIYHIERMLLNLKYSGKFEYLKGLIVGNFTNIKDTTPSFGMSVKEIILSVIKDYNFPVIFDFPAGHENINLPLLIGSKTSIMANKNTTKVIIHRNEI